MGLFRSEISSGRLHLSAGICFMGRVQCTDDLLPESVFLRSCQYDTPFDRRSDLMVLLGLLIADGLGSGIAVLELKRKKGRIEQITEELQKTSKFLENALTKRIQKRLVKAFPNIETEKDAEQEEKFAEGCGFFKLASLFIIGAFIGDIVETIFCLITTGRLMSRSSLGLVSSVSCGELHVRF